MSVYKGEGQFTQRQGVRVLPNEWDKSASSDNLKGFSAHLDKPLTKVRGSMEHKDVDSKSGKAPKSVYKATAVIGTPGTKGTYGDPSFGATGIASASGLTKNEARRKAYNKASDDKMKDTTTVSERIRREDAYITKRKADSRLKNPPPVVKINTNPVKDSD